MAQRTILIQNRAHLCVRNGLLQIETDEKSLAIPLEDIWVVIVESHLSTLTVSCMSSLNEAGIGVMICGRNHMPNGLLLPLGAHSRHARIVEDQLTMSLPMKKQLWKRIVRAKIENQAAVLREMGIDSTPLDEYAASVQSGDKNNRESAAAAVYFKRLIKDGTRRASIQSAALRNGSFSAFGGAIAGLESIRIQTVGGWARCSVPCRIALCCLCAPFALNTLRAELSSSCVW